MCGAFGFAQGYFGQGPMIVIAVVDVDGPIRVAHLRSKVATLTVRQRTLSAGLTLEQATVHDLTASRPTLTFDG